MNLKLDVAPTEDGQIDAKLDFGELEAGTNYKFIINITNISRFDLVDITATVRPDLLQITGMPHRIGAGNTGKMDMELNIPTDIIEPIRPDIEMDGVFLLR